MSDQGFALRPPSRAFPGMSPSCETRQPAATYRNSGVAVTRKWTNSPRGGLPLTSPLAPDDASTNERHPRLPAAPHRHGETRCDSCATLPNPAAPASVTCKRAGTRISRLACSPPSEHRVSRAGLSGLAVFERARRSSRRCVGECAASRSVSTSIHMRIPATLSAEAEHHD